MTTTKRIWQQVGPLEAAALIVAGIALALVIAGQVDPVALIILLILGYFVYMARGILRQARRFRPVEPPNTWLITLAANLALMGLGIGSFGWYMAGGGSRTWIPFLIFIAGMMALRQWRRDVTNKLYAWRTPALMLLQKDEYKQLIRALEDDATAGTGHPDVAYLTVHFANNFIAHLHVNWLSPVKIRQMLIGGAAAAVTFGVGHLIGVNIAG